MEMSKFYVTLSDNYKVQIPEWMIGKVICDPSAMSEDEIKEDFLSCCVALFPLGRDRDKAMAEEYIIKHAEDESFYKYLDEKDFYIRLCNEYVKEAKVVAFDSPRYNDDPDKRMKVEEVVKEHPEFRDVDYVIYYFLVWSIGLEQIHYIYKMDENSKEVPTHDVYAAFYKIMEYHGKKYLFFVFE